jgi:hypothetical protein
LKNFTFTSRYTYNKVENNGAIINDYAFLDLDLTYQKKDSKWEYSFEMTNALDTNALNTNNGTNLLFTSTSTYVIQPRFTVLSIKYNL